MLKQVEKETDSFYSVEYITGTNDKVFKIYASHDCQGYNIGGIMELTKKEAHQFVRELKQLIDTM